MTAESPELSLAAEFPDATESSGSASSKACCASRAARHRGAAAEDALATALQDGLPPARCTPPRTHAADPGYPGFAALRPRRHAPKARPSPAGTYASATRGPIPRAPTRPCSPTWRTASPPCGWPSAPAACRWPGWPRPSTASISTWRRSCSTRAPNSPPPAGSCCGCTTSGGVRAAGRAGNLGADPLGHVARTGDDGGPAPTSGRAARLARRCAPRAPRAARAGRGRAAVPRGGRLGRRGAGLLAGHRRRLSARPDRRRADRRRGLRRSWSSATPPPPTSS